MLDDGHPLTTESNTLRDIVLPPSIINKILSAAGVSGTLTTTVPAPFSSPIPWRRTGVKYNNNEIYFDFVEHYDAIVSRTGAVIFSEIRSKVLCNCRLSGTPDLWLNLTNANRIVDPSFHSCIRLQKFASSKALSFVPPDGQFTLMECKIEEKQPLPLQVQLKPSVELSENGGSFKFTISSRTPPTKPLEGVLMVIHLGKRATGVSCTTSLSFPPGPGSEGKESSWNWDLKTQHLQWSIPILSSATPHTLQGTFTSTEQHPRISRAVTISYHVPASPQSTVLKVDQLKVGGETYKPYKGVKHSGIGKIEWRL
jgi:AP-3 complex subunit mu